ncbi:hypothetical protein [Vibrio phage pTD1]|uniref:Uncharacterized protein n=1 Tax=Vibrio phage pTD1 TaxID=1938577 RepID=A0A1Q2U2M5_9CAUD|nr:hypothetical protein FDH33_gp002 [Vibrio phage pTD1]BAW98211.1 hypothetical protein [Vibrio phage pTD1]
MLIKKINTIEDLPKDLENYRRGVITSRAEDDRINLVITMIAGWEKPYFHLVNKVAHNPEEALVHIEAIKRDYPNAEVYGNFTPEVVAFLREHKLYTNLLPCNLFHSFKTLKLIRVDDVEDIEFQEHVKVGTVFKKEDTLTYQCANDKPEDAPTGILVSLGKIETINELTNVLTLIKVYEKTANVYIECGNGLSKLMTEKGIQHIVY